jgi:hypothetical protein
LNLCQVWLTAEAIQQHSPIEATGALNEMRHGPVKDILEQCVSRTHPDVSGAS